VNAPPVYYIEYLRVSGAGQEQRHTIAHQREALRRLAAGRLGTLIASIEEPKHISGATLASEREGGRKLAACVAENAHRVKEGAVLEIRYFELSRVTRSDDKVEIARLYQIAEKSGAIWVDAKGMVIDPKGVMDYQVWVMLCHFSALERKSTRERTISGRIRNLGAGKPANGALPWGIEWSPMDGWRFDDEKLAPVRRAFELALTLGHHAICDAMKAERYRPPRGGDSWGHATLAGWLSEPAYMGKLRHRIAGHEGVIDLPIQVVSPELYDAVQLRTASRRKARRRDFYSIDWLTRGFAYCSACRRPMTLQNRTGGGAARYFNVRCRHPDCENGTAYHAEALDTAVWVVVRAALDSDGGLLHEAAALEPQGAPGWEERLALAESGLAENVAAQRLVMRQLTRPALAEAAQAQLDDLEREAHALERMREESERGIRQRATLKERVGEAQETIAALRAQLDGADFTTRRAVLEAVLQPEGRIWLGSRNHHGTATFQIAGSMLGTPILAAENGVPGALARGAMSPARSSRCTNGSNPGTG
jgi:hypothetical protein